MATKAAYSTVDLKRALATLKAVGNHVVRVDFPPEGGFRILTSDKPGGPVNDDAGPNPLDRALGLQ